MNLNTAGKPPLQGVRVLDFTLHAAGPFCTHLLTLLGAQCIKIETAARPDIFRKPHPVYGRLESATFDQVNAGKESIRLNLKHPQGLALARELAAACDIVAESFRPGVMKRLGLDYPTLRALKPELVMVSVSSAGQSGPDAGHAGYAPLFGAGGGLGTLTGYEDGPPVEVRHVMDHSTGLAAATAVLAAWYRKRRTGQGQHVDVAATDVASSFVGDALLMAAFAGQPPARQGNDMPGCAPHNVYPCAGHEQWLALAVSTDEQWQRFNEVAGARTPWSGDERFGSPAGRFTYRRELDALIGQWTATQSRDDLARRLQDLQVPAIASASSAELADCEHLRARGVVTTLPGDDARRVVGPPWRFSATPARLERGTPALGEHIESVFVGVLGIERARIAQWVRDEVIW